MKKLISIFICIISIFSIFISYNKFDVDKNNSIANIEHKIGKIFEIPDSPVLSDSKEIYTLLEKVAKQLNVNVLRQRVISNKDGDLEIRKYILLTSSTKFFDDINIDNKYNIIKNLHDNKFLYTKHTNDTNQIGLIKDFANNDNLYIGSLNDLYNISPVYGKYFVETPSESVFENFIKKFVDEINNTNKFDNVKFNYSDFISKSDENVHIKEIDKNLILYKNLILMIIMILMIFMILNNSKKISIYKLFGISNLRIWLIISQINITKIFASITIVSVFVSLILQFDINFIIYIIKYQLLSYLTITVLSLFPYFIIARTNININIKNKKNDQFLFVFYNLLKILLIYIIIFTSTSILNNSIEINKDLPNLNSWEKSKSYGIFYPKYTGYDESQEEKRKSNVTLSNELYKILNKQGSIFVSSKEYTEEYLQDNKVAQVTQSIKINPNYLKEFTIYSDSNKIINISENEKDYILLVPETYKNKEQSILKEFKGFRTALFEYEKEMFSGIVPKDIKNQNIKIIWTRKNQNIFSFNPEVFKEEHNMIKDPIVEVFTENNSISSDRFGILGGGSSDPLKIKLINNDPKITYNKLKPDLIELHLEDNLKNLISSNELMLEKIYNLKEELHYLYIVLIISSICFVIILLQNLILIFNRYKKRIIIKKIFGLNFFYSYKEYILLFCANWIIQLILFIKTINKNLIIILIFIVLEFFFSLVSLNILERKNKINVLKGE
ncbi:TPA: DUF1430 domain-containing protein [Clostridioides difficile]